MSYMCMTCGNEVEYDYLTKHKLKCTACSEKRSNIWIKCRPDNISKTVLAR